MRYTRTPETNADPFSLSALKSYLRVEHSDEDTVIQGIGLTAASEIEAYCEIALLSQTITATSDQWPGSVIDLPCGPLLEGQTATVSVIEADGTLTPVPSGWWIEGGLYPRIHFTGTTPGACLRITYSAGYGPTVADVPPALTHALHDQALRMFTRRGDEDMQAGLSPTTARLLARFRRLRA